MKLLFGLSSYCDSRICMGSNTTSLRKEVVGAQCQQPHRSSTCVRVPHGGVVTINRSRSIVDVALTPYEREKKVPSASLTNAWFSARRRNRYTCRDGSAGDGGVEIQSCVVVHCRPLCAGDDDNRECHGGHAHCGNGSGARAAAVVVASVPIVEHTVGHLHRGEGRGSACRLQMEKGFRRGCASVLCRRWVLHQEWDHVDTNLAIDKGDAGFSGDQHRPLQARLGQSVRHTHRLSARDSVKVARATSNDGAANQVRTGAHSS